MAQRSYVIGLVCRREFRRALLEWGLDYREDKGWLDSLFVVRGDAATLGRFNRQFLKWAADLEAADGA